MKYMFLVMFFFLMVQITGCTDTEMGKGNLSDDSRNGSHSFLDQDIHLYGSICDFSGKEIRSRRYGAVVKNAEGDFRQYNSIENMIRSLHSRNELQSTSFQIGIVEFISANRMLLPDELIFYYSSNLPSPGGFYLSAMDKKADERLMYNIREAYPGQTFNWEQVIERVLSEQ